MLKTIMKQANVRFTYDDYLLLPEDKRCEILDGELFVVPAPNVMHQRVGLRLKLALFHHVQDHGAGEVLDAPCTTKPQFVAVLERIFHRGDAEHAETENAETTGFTDGSQWTRAFAVPQGRRCAPFI